MGPTSGIEPLTPALQVRCATNCATSAYSELLANYVRSDGYLRPAVISANSQAGDLRVDGGHLRRRSGREEGCMWSFCHRESGGCNRSV
jgi:hypothetical protein